MKTVKEVSILTGASIRALRHYDSIGLLRPTNVTEAGYRLYDEAAVEKLRLILVYRELGFSLDEIRTLLDVPDHDRNEILQHQIGLMEEKVRKLQNRITFAKGMELLGVKHMKLSDFDPKKVDDYTSQAKALYGKTRAYKEYQEKAQGRSTEQEQELGSSLMDLFTRLGQMRPCQPDSPEALAWAKALQAFLTQNYYTCTPQILQGLGQMYAGGGSMTENIDKAGGAGTGAFAKEVIDAYVNKL